MMAPRLLPQSESLLALRDTSLLSPLRPITRIPPSPPPREEPRRLLPPRFIPIHREYPLAPPPFNPIPHNETMIPPDQPPSLTPLPPSSKA
ncbi:hypothetical protein EMCG_00112 [[Emmonsia] crescens]|uniref:Uncharacterized protein n=1 Tax=[Emmonsia] crescens TaxID=73230 RepID=A0A0G2HZ57_9EURO|nr:hypothetical protein EMCG_00112 [Emmonsia crescens UAMH 3008]